MNGFRREAILTSFERIRSLFFLISLGLNKNYVTLNLVIEGDSCTCTRTTFLLLVAVIFGQEDSK